MSQYLPDKPTEAMRAAMDGESPYFWRRSEDKTHYEVAMRKNEDWEVVIPTSDEIEIVARFETESDAEDLFKRLAFTWRYKEMLRVAPQGVNPPPCALLQDGAEV